MLNEGFFAGLYERVVRIDENLQRQFQENDTELVKYKQLLTTKEKEFTKH